MIKHTILIVLLTLFAMQAWSQDEEIRYVLGYKTIAIKVTNDKFLTRYIAPGQEPVCGFYSKYNNRFYLPSGKYIKDINTDYLYQPIAKCTDTFLFDNGPRPYAMMEFPLTITSVDYETNTIYGKTDGAEVIIQTFNKEIDAFYNKFYKVERLEAVHANIVLKNWDYTPESEDSFVENTKRKRNKRHYKGKKAKLTEEELLHDVDYQKEDKN